jgi:hypothetical protein
MGNEILKPQKIRIRSAQELGTLVTAYRKIFKESPLGANLLLLLSELSEYVFIPTEDEKLNAWIQENKVALHELISKRFKNPFDNAIPLDGFDSSVYVGPISTLRH